MKILALLFLTISLSQTSVASEVADKLAELGIELPGTSAKSVANYIPASRAGNIVFLSGTIARDENGDFIQGKLGEDMDVDEAYAVARKVGIALITSLLIEIGDLDKVKKIVKVEGYVNSTAEFEKQSLVINGCSDLLVDVFGEKGRHTRIAVGANALPFGAPVEISAIVEISE